MESLEKGVFRVVQVYGTWQGDPVGTDTRKLIFLAQRR